MATSTAQSTGPAAAAATYNGPDRRSGFERRTVAPREDKSGPQIVSPVHVPGHGVFRRGQEKQLAEAVRAFNEKAEKGAPRIDLELLEARGALRNFSGKAAKGAKGTAGGGPQWTRNRQNVPGTDDVEEPGHDNSAPIPGGVPLEQLAPDPDAAAEKGTAARTGGAGRTDKPGPVPAGERAAAQHAAAQGAKGTGQK